MTQPPVSKPDDTASASASNDKNSRPAPSAPATSKSSATSPDSTANDKSSKPTPSSTPASTVYPAVSIKNNLSIPIVVYDSFVNSGGSQSSTDYFGTLTNMATVAAGATVSISPLHGPISAYIIFDTGGNPIKQVLYMPGTTLPFQVASADVAVITATTNFVSFLASSPADPLAVSFQNLIKGGQATISQINSFFQATANYSTCTFSSYMLVITALARTPASASAPVESKTYSLSSLCQSMGMAWPPGFPDIAVSNFSYSDTNDLVQLGGELNINNVTFDEGVLANVLTILPSETVQFSVSFNYSPGLSIGNTSLTFVFDSLSIPVGNSKTITIASPTVTLNITPLFKFVVFEIEASIPFTLFDGPTFNAAISMTIDNVEAEIGVVIEGQNAATLPAPPILNGVHFNQIGVGMGLFFEPPGYVLGVQGQFQIGTGANIIALDDDTFALVCELEGDIPNPLYISFYVPQMTLSQIVTIFTNTTNNISFPISISDLSFTWAENPMQPVTLPDGTLTSMAYGFSGLWDIFGLSFYGNVSIDLSNGLNGILTMSPFSIGGLLNLSGNGKAVSIMVDASGNPIKNNQLATTVAEQNAIKNATSKQIVAAGGPEMTVSMTSSPYFTLGANLAFLGFNDSVQSTIGSNGISFSLDFGSLISADMNCVLQNQSFTGSFAYGPNFSIPLPGSLGNIPLTATINSTLALSEAASVVDFSVSGGFDFEGLNRNFGPASLSVNITGLEDVLSSIENWIVTNAEQIFSDILGDVSKWAGAIYSNAIVPLEPGAAYVVGIFKNTFNQTAQELGPLLKGSTYALSDIANAMTSTFGPAANDVASVLSTAYNATETEVTQALQAAGYTAEEIAGALVSAFDAVETDVASIFNTVGIDAQDAASAISSAFSNLEPALISGFLQAGGYAVSDISSAFQALGGDFSSYATAAWDTVVQYANPSNW